MCISTAEHAKGRIGSVGTLCASFILTHLDLSAIIGSNHKQLCVQPLELTIQSRSHLPASNAQILLWTLRTNEWNGQLQEGCLDDLRVCISINPRKLRKGRQLLVDFRNLEVLICDHRQKMTSRHHPHLQHPPCNVARLEAMLGA